MAGETYVKSLCLLVIRKSMCGEQDVCAFFKVVCEFQMNTFHILIVYLSFYYHHLLQLIIIWNWWPLRYNCKMKIKVICSCANKTISPHANQRFILITFLAKMANWILFFAIVRMFDRVSWSAIYCNFKKKKFNADEVKWSWTLKKIAKRFRQRQGSNLRDRSHEITENAKFATSSLTP